LNIVSENNITGHRTSACINTLTVLKKTRLWDNIKRK